MPIKVVPTSKLFKGHSGATVMLTEGTPVPETPMRSMKLYDDGFVKVRGSLPRAASASPRRVQAALKAKMAVRALERALLVARGSLHAATGTLRGAEVTTYTRLALARELAPFAQYAQPGAHEALMARVLRDGRRALRKES